MAHFPGTENVSGWYATLPPPGPAKTLSQNLRVQWAIVGAGFAGVAAARRLAQLRPNDHIALIEAQRIGWGSCGRNSGFMIDLPHDLATDAYTGKQDEDRRLIRLNRAAIKFAGDTVAANGIDCDWQPQGKLHGAIEASGERALEAFMRGLDALGEAYTPLSHDDMVRRTGLHCFRAGVHTPGTVLIQPAAYIRGCVDSLPDNVHVIEQCEITRIEGASPVRLHASHAEITADQVLLTNNGYAEQLGFPKGRFIHVATYGSQTRELTDSELQTLGGEESWGLIPANPMGTTLRKLNNRRLIVRNVFTYNPQQKITAKTLKKVETNHRRAYLDRFKGLEHVPFEHTWGGVLCLSQNNMPFFGQLAPNIHAAVCQNGLGVARGTIAGKLLAERVVGQDSELLRDIQMWPAPNRLPPSPLLRVGVPATLAWKQYRAGRE